MNIVFVGRIYAICNLFTTDRQIEVTRGPVFRLLSVGIGPENQNKNYHRNTQRTQIEQNNSILAIGTCHI